MPAPRWDLFAGITLLVLVVLLMLARLSQQLLVDPEQTEEAAVTPVEPTRTQTGVESPDESVPLSPAEHTLADPTPEQLSPSALLVNVALSQGLLAGVLIAAVWYAQIPATALGLGTRTIALHVVPAVGIGLGVVMYVANEAAATITEWSGIEHSERLREVLAPSSLAGWAILLGGVLPVIAGFEELLFRGALIGALATGYGISPWGLAVASSVVFGFGHGAQGRGGIVVTAALGFALAAAFVVTDSLAVVVIAHYLINALEFIVHEGIGWER